MPSAPIPPADASPGTVGFTAMNASDDPLRPEHSPWDARLAWVLCSLMVLAAVLRIAASCNDLALDEIWTLKLIETYVRHPADLIRGVMRHDNNHLLNTLWMYALGPHLHALVYRLPSAAAGTAAVYAAWLFGKSRGPAAAIACAAVVAIDQVLVHAGSEARGYGMLSLATVVAQVALLAGFGQSSDEARPAPLVPPWAVAFNVTVAIGLLAHLTFVIAYAAGLIWSVGRSAFDRRESFGRLVARLAIWHAAPTSILAAITFGFVRGMQYGRGPRNDFFTAVVETCSAIAGGPLEMPWAYGVAALTLVAGCLAMASCYRHDRPRAWLMLLSVFLVPAGVYACFPIAFYAVRLFQVPAQTLALLVASEWPSLAGRMKSPLPMVLCGAFVIANLSRDATLIGRGRGGYVRAIRHMIDTSPEASTPVTASCVSDFRTQMLLEYHQATLPCRKVRLYQDDLPPTGAEWFIIEDHRHGGTAARRIADRHGNVYGHDLSVRGGGIAPIHWHLFRRVLARP